MNKVNAAQRDTTVLNAVLRQDLYSFVCKAGQELTGDFQPNWHIKAMCHELELLYVGIQLRLVMCLPPRHFKSTVGVAFLAWVHGLDPTLKTISVTYNSELASKFTSDFRRIITSRWYQSAFPDARIARHKNTEGEIAFTKGGSRIGTTMTGTLTGRGGDIILLDDCLKAQDAASDTRRETNNAFYVNTILSRLDDHNTGRIVLLAQRLHANDFPGSFMEIEEECGKLILPAIATGEERIQLGDGKVHYRKEGDPLFPNRMPLATLRDLERKMGPDHFGAQFQQTPVPAGGLIIKKEWLSFYKEPIEPRYPTTVFQSWDTAGRTGARNSYSVGVTFAKRQNEYWLLDLVRGRFDYPALRETAIQFAKKWKPTYILIEDASTGLALGPDLNREAHRHVEMVPVSLSKVDRLWEQAPKFVNHLVHFPENAPYTRELVKEILAFPQTKFSDQVDAISQALAFDRYVYTLDNIY